MSDVRTYRGLSARQRLIDRKERLLAAALERFGGQGYSATTIETLCTDAKVSTRGFYECFDSRESLLRALYEQIIAAAEERVKYALDDSDGTVPGLVHAGLAAYIGYMTDDERRARISHVEVRRAGEPLHSARRRAVYEFAELVATLAGDRAELTELAGPDRPLDVRRVAIGLVGAVQELIIDWVHATPRPAPEDVITTAEYLFLAAFWRTPAAPAEAAYNGPAPGGPPQSAGRSSGHRRS
jgi:AcrR family transcriptional regulator